MNDKNARAYRIQNFLFSQKKQNKGKYAKWGANKSDEPDNLKAQVTQEAGKGAFSLQVPKGTISILSSKTQSNNLFTVKNYYKFASEKSMFKIRWRVIQWLW